MSHGAAGIDGPRHADRILRVHLIHIQPGETEMDGGWLVDVDGLEFPDTFLWIDVDDCWCVDFNCCWTKN